GAVADAGDVGQQRVEPDVDGEALVPRHADAPALAGARDVQVLQALLDQRDDLVAPALRLDEVGVLLVVAQQPVAELRLLEIVAVLAAADQRRAGVQRADAAGLLTSCSVLNASQPLQY